MAKVDAPLLSFGSRGTIAKTQVYSSWRGIAYARRWVKPGNPQKAEQTKTRNAFSWASGLWKFAASGFKAPWDAYATGQKFVGRNAFIGQNTKALRDETAITDFVASPGALGGQAITSMVVTDGGAQTVHIVPTLPTPPSGWNPASVVGVAIKAANPQASVDYTSYTDDNSVTPFAVDIVVVAGDYVVFAWPTWTRPDGKIAYGPAISDTVTIA